MAKPGPAVKLRGLRPSALEGKCSACLPKLLCLASTDLPCSLPKLVACRLPGSGTKIVRASATTRCMDDIKKNSLKVEGCKK